MYSLNACWECRSLPAKMPDECAGHMVKDKDEQLYRGK